MLEKRSSEKANKYQKLLWLELTRQRLETVEYYLKKFVFPRDVDISQKYLKQVEHLHGEIESETARYLENDYSPRTLRRLIESLPPDVEDTLENNELWQDIQQYIAEVDNLIKKEDSSFSLLKNCMIKDTLQFGLRDESIPHLEKLFVIYAFSAKRKNCFKMAEILQYLNFLGFSIEVDFLGSNEWPNQIRNSKLLLLATLRDLDLIWSNKNTEDKAYDRVDYIRRSSDYIEKIRCFLFEEDGQWSKLEETLTKSDDYQIPRLFFKTGENINPRFIEGLIKFIDEDTASFERVLSKVNQIQKIASGVPESLEEIWINIRSESRNAPMLPEPKFSHKKTLIYQLSEDNRVFSGRNKELKEIHEGFEKKTNGVQKQLLVGPKGFGKSQIAKYYAGYYKTEYQYIFKIEESDIYGSLKKIFNDLKFLNKISETCPNNTRKIFKCIERALQNIDDWLMVVDNFKTYESAQDYFPNCPEVSRGHILVTANSSKSHSKIIPIKEFTEWEAIKYVKECLKNQDRSDKSNADSIKLLCQQLRCYPLALTLAMGYLRNRPTESLEHYANCLALSSNNEPFKVLVGNKDLLSELDEYTSTIDKVLQTTLSYIKEEDHDGEVAIELLLFLSIIDSNGVHHQLIHDFFKQYNASLSKEEINHAIDTLLNFYLLERIGSQRNHLYRAHVITARLMTLSSVSEQYKTNFGFIDFIKNLFLENKVDKIIDKATAYFEENFTYFHNESSDFLVDLVPHIEVIEQYITQPHKRAFFLLKLGAFYLFEQRNYRNASLFFERLEQIISQIPEKEKKSLEYIEIQLLIYQAILGIERDRNGLPEASKKVEMAKNKLLTIRPQTEEQEKILTYCNIVIQRVLGQHASFAGDYFLAKKQLEKANTLSQIYKQTFKLNKNKEVIIVTLEEGYIGGTLARVYAQMGCYKQSLDSNKEAIRCKEIIKGKGDHDVIASKLTSISACIHLCDFSNAFKEIEEYEDGMRKSFPDGGMPAVYQHAVDIQKGWFYLSVGDFNRACLVLNGVIGKGYGRESEAYLPLAYCYFLRGDLRVSREWLDKIKGADTLSIEALFLKARILFIESNQQEAKNLLAEGLDRLTEKLASFTQNFHPLHLKYYLLIGDMAYENNDIEGVEASLEAVKRVLDYLFEKTKNYTQGTDKPFHLDYSDYYLLQIKYFSLKQCEKATKIKDINDCLNEISRVNGFVFDNYRTCYRIKEIGKIAAIIEYNASNDKVIKLSKHPRFSLSIERLKLLQEEDKSHFALKLWIFAGLLQQDCLDINILKQYYRQRLGENFNEELFLETLNYLENHKFLERKKVLESSSSPSIIYTKENDLKENLTNRIRSFSSKVKGGEVVSYYYKLTDDATNIIHEIQLSDNKDTETYQHYQFALNNAADFLLDAFSYSHGTTINVDFTYIVHLNALQKSLEFEKEYIDKRMSCLLKLGEYYFFELRDNKKALKFLEELIRLIDVYQSSMEIDLTLLIETYAYAAMAHIELKMISSAFNYADLAQNHFLTLEKSEKDSVRHLYYSVIINRMVGQRQSFQAEYFEAQKTLNRAEKSMETYMKLTKKSLDMEKAYIDGTLARVEMFLGNYEKALRLNTDVIDYKKKIKGENDFEVAASYLTIIECNLKRCNYKAADEALRTFEAILNDCFENTTMAPPVLRWAHTRHKAMYLCESGQLKEARSLLQKINEETLPEYACRPLIYIYLAKINFIEGDIDAACSNLAIVNESGSNLLKIEANVISGFISLLKGSVEEASSQYQEGMNLGESIFKQFWNTHLLKAKLYNLKIAIYIHEISSEKKSKSNKTINHTFKQLEAVFPEKGSHVDYAHYCLLRGQYLLLKNKTFTHEVIHWVDESKKTYENIYGLTYTNHPEVEQLSNLEDCCAFLRIDNLAIDYKTKYGSKIFKAMVDLDVDLLIDSLNHNDCKLVGDTPDRLSNFYKRFYDKRVSVSAITISKTIFNKKELTMLTKHDETTYNRPFNQLVQAYTGFITQLESCPANYGISKNGLFNQIIECFTEDKDGKAIRNELMTFMRGKEIRDFLKESDSTYGYSAPLYCVSKDCFIVYNYLVREEGFGQDMITANGLQAMHLAVLHRSYNFLEKSLKTINRLPESEIQLSSELALKLNPLHLAVMCDDFKAVQLIFNQVKSIDHAVPLVGNIINLAAIFSGKDMVQFLLIQTYSSKVTISQLLKSKDSVKNLAPLSWAAQLGKIDVVDYFLQCLGQDVTVGDNAEIIQTAFYVAANAGQKEIVKLFRLHGFQPEARHSEYNDTIIAIREPYPDVFNIINTQLKADLESHYEKPEPKTQVYRNLVFQGGGMKGAIFPYALIHLENTCKARMVYASEQGYPDNEQRRLDVSSSIERVAGTSAGSIFALGCALGLAGELLKEETDYDFGAFLDTPELDNLSGLVQQDNIDFNTVMEKLVGLDEKGTLAKLKVHVEEMTAIYKNMSDEKGNVSFGWHPVYTIQLCKEALKVKTMLPDIMKKLQQKNEKFKGFSKGEAIYNWIKTFMQAQGIENPETFTFGDLAQYIKEKKVNPKTGLPFKHLYAVVTSLDTNVPIVLTSESTEDEYANYVILDAIRASMSIPVAFEPWPLVCISAGMRTETRQRFVDGGLLTNYPISVFDKKLFVDSDARGDMRHPLLNKATLGFSFKGSAFQPLKADCTLKDFLLHMTNMYFEAESIIAAFEDKDYGRSIILDTGTVSTFSFKKLDEKEKQVLDGNSKKAVEGYFFPNELVPEIKLMSMMDGSDNKTNAHDVSISLTQTVFQGSSWPKVKTQPYKIAELLNLVGKSDEDSLSLSETVAITRAEIEHSIIDFDNPYTADFINLLLYPLNSDSIKVYPAILGQILKDYHGEIKEQQQTYAFIPLNVSYDENDPEHKNHWVAVIVNKELNLVFYLDPAKKTKIPAALHELKEYLGYNKNILMNPIDFQQKEKVEGFIRHCGAYTVELFTVFSNLKNCISGSEIADPSIKHSISLQTALSVIPCGEADNISTIREQHVKKACNILSNVPPVMETIVQSATKKESNFPQLVNHLKELIPNILGHKQKTKRFSFAVTKNNEQELCVQLTTLREEIALEKEEIKNQLLLLKNALEKDLLEQGLEDGVHYDIIKFNAKTGTLNITATEIAVLSCIGNVLKEAGQNYWQSSQWANSSVFFFKAQTSESKSIETEVISIICGIQ